MSRCIVRTLMAVLILTAAGANAAEQLQLKNLKDTPAKARFTMPQERVWPGSAGSAGEADICLWADDKFAAINLTIDDNMAQDHAWWIAQAKKNDFRATWYVITGPNHLNSGNPAFGTWNSFRKLKALGHDVQTHTVEHKPNDHERPAKLVEAGYRVSKTQLEKNIPGNKCLTIAYPHGKCNRDLAAKYFIAGRGVYGTPNDPAKTDYMDVHSAGGKSLAAMIDGILTGKSAIKWVGPQYKRGWCSFHWHGVKDKAKNAKNLAYMATKKDQLWIGTFNEIAKYGQERDTAKLAVTSAGPDRIAFTISDDMDNALFDFPLTVKVHVFDTWSTVNATQGGEAVEATLVEHEGGKFALVKAVPDRGEVELTAKPNELNAK